MRNTLIILLDSVDLNASKWILVDATGHVSEPGNCTVENFMQLKDDRVVTVLVPSEDVLLLPVTLPPMSRSKLMHALPFALEEQLIGDIETQHIVMGDLLESGEIPVAVVSHDKMSLWQTKLKEWGLQANRMLPAVLALPWETPQWHVAINDTCMIRNGRDSGFAGDPQIAPELIDAALWAAANQPEKIVVHAYAKQTLSSEDSSVQLARSQVNVTPLLNQNDLVTKLSHLPSVIEHGIQVEMKQCSQHNFLFDLAASLPTASSLNLLQGAYAAKRQRLRETKKIARVAAGLIAGFVLLLFLNPLVSSMLLQGRVSDLNAQIAKIYYHEFPNASSVVSPKRRMEDKVHKVSSQLGSNRFLLLMSYVGKAMQEATSISIKKLQYQQNHLSLEISAGNTADFTTFTEFLTHQSLSVKQQNAVVAGTHVNAVVEVE